MVQESGLLYGETYTSALPILIECDEELLSDFKSGSVHVKADKAGITNLCSSSKTYKMRHVDNSNSLLVAGEDSGGSSVIHSLAKGVVHLEELRTDSIPMADIVNAFQDNMPLDEAVAHLCYRTVWSGPRVREFLSATDFFYVEEGTWKMIRESEFYSLLHQILNACAVVGPSSDNTFNTEDICMTISESVDSDTAPSFHLIQYLISRLSPKSSPEYQNKGTSEWPLHLTLDSRRILLHRGHQLMFQHFSTRGNINIDRFVLEWKDALESTVCVDYTLLDEDILTSVIPELIDKRAVLDGDLLLKCDSRALSLEIDGRVNELFAIKKQWPKPEFEAFIRPILLEGCKPESALMKSCRLDQEDNGEWFYSNKF